MAYAAAVCFGSRIVHSIPVKAMGTGVVTAWGKPLGALTCALTATVVVKARGRELVKMGAHPLVLEKQVVGGAGALAMDSQKRTTKRLRGEP